MLNEFAEGERIVVPNSVVRTVSLEKLKSSAPQSQKHSNLPTNSSKPKPEKQANRAYDKMLDRKLGVKSPHELLKEKLAGNADKPVSKKFQELKKEVQMNEMKECTFKPHTNIPMGERRNVNEFFNEQLDFNRKKNDRIEEMRNMIQANKEKENIFRPNALIAREKKGGEDVSKVYERLYEDSKNKDKSNAISRQESTQTLRNNSITKSKRFKGISRGNSIQKITRSQNLTPSISQDQPQTETPHQIQQFHKESITLNQEGNSIDLSSIASRKASTEMLSKQLQGKSGETTCREGKSRDPNKRIDVNIYQKKDNSKNEEIYIAKLMKEMIIVMQKCGLPLVFSYMQMNLFFEKMNFMPKETPVNSRKLLYEIWNTLQGEIFQQVSALSIMKIVYAIMGCHNVAVVNKCISDHWLVDSQAMEEYDRSLKMTGKKLSFKQNILMLTERDSKTIKSSFDELYLNRLKIGESELIKEEKATSYSFKPTISKASTELAERYRNRILCESEKLIAQNKISFEVPEDGQIDHVNLLMLDEKRKDAVLQMKREEREKERRKMEDETMSNHNLTERSSNRSSRNKVGPTKDRNQELYEMGKHVNKHKKDKSTDQITEEKWKNELTFKPNINSKNNILNVLNSKEAFIPDYDKAIYRMHEGRKLRDNSRQEKADNTSPLLYLNVVMEGSESVKVPVFSNDNMKSITEKVRTMMQLDRQEGSGKLQKILKMQILPALKQMGLQNFINE